jgi:hypothetical protein
MPSLTKVLLEVSANPGSWLEHFDAIALDQLISGFRSADASCARLINELQMTQSPPTTQMSPLIRIHLDHAGFEEGTRSALAFLGKVAAELGESGTPTPLVGQSCIDVLVDAIGRGRIGMYLGEPSLTCLIHFVRGHLAAVDQFRVQSAREQQIQLGEFEAYVQREYSEPKAPWYRVLSVYEGSGMPSLKAFAQQWRNWLSSRREAPDGAPVPR